MADIRSFEESPGLIETSFEMILDDFGSWNCPLHILGEYDIDSRGVVVTVDEVFALINEDCDSWFHMEIPVCMFEGSKLYDIIIKHIESD